LANNQDHRYSDDPGGNQQLAPAAEPHFYFILGSILHSD
jgi:hypothetical protein